MSDEALQPIAPQIEHLLRDLRRITGGDAQRETSRHNLSDNAPVLWAKKATLPA